MLQHEYLNNLSFLTNLLAIYSFTPFLLRSLQSVSLYFYDFRLGHHPSDLQSERLNEFRIFHLFFDEFFSPNKKDEQFLLHKEFVQLSSTLYSSAFPSVTRFGLERALFCIILMSFSSLPILSSN